MLGVGKRRSWDEAEVMHKVWRSSILGLDSAGVLINVVIFMISSSLACPD